MHRTPRSVVALGMLTAQLFSSHAAAQPPAQDRLVEMQAIASALGVSCDYCHKNMRGRAADGETPVPEPEKAVALAMMAMTRDLNARVQSATGKPAGEATTVRCVTCHRGVPIPRPLDEIVFQAVLRDGAPAAAAQYRDLRQRYFGRGTYDFGEEALLGVARRFAQSRPPDAITLLEMNLEFHPESADGYAALGYAYTRLGDDGSALTYLEKALELQPENGTVRGQVEQLRRFQRR